VRLAQVFFVAGFAAPLLPVGEFVVVFSFNSVSALAMVRRSLSDSPSGDRLAHRHERANPNSSWPSDEGHRGTAATICSALGIGRTTWSATSPTATRTDQTDVSGDHQRD